MSRKVQFTVNKNDIIVELRDTRSGIYWSYQDAVVNSGPFRSDSSAIYDAKLYSQYGTTTKELLKIGTQRRETLSDRLRGATFDG